MSRFFHAIALGAVMLSAPGLLFSQVGGGVAAGGSFSSSVSASGSGGSVSSSGNSSQTTFNFNYPPGAMVLVIAGAPYSGHITSQNVRTLANGTHLNVPTVDQPMTYRDSLGRIRTDAAMSPVPMMAPAAANFKPRMMRLPEISDPVAGFRYIIDDTNRITHRIAIQARQDQAAARAALAARPPVPQASPLTRENGLTFSSESLGTKSMFGIAVTGQRETTYPPWTYQGNDAPLTSVTETWRSEQYRLVLLTRSSQPDGSESTMAMKEFSVAEPDPTLFMVPAGYQIVDETGSFTITVPADPKQAAETQP
jgi:hypothetical protein